MQRTRHVIVVAVVVTTALCAHNALATTPSSKQPAASQGLARALAARLTHTLRQAVAPAMQLQPVRVGQTASTPIIPARTQAEAIHTQFTPFQFRLPPPIL